MARGKERSEEDKRKLIEAIKPKLELGMSITKACEMSEVPISTISDILIADDKKGGSLRLEIKAWQSKLSERALQNVAMDIAPELRAGGALKGDVKTSMTWLERKMPDEFAPITKQQVEQMNPVQIIEVIRPDENEPKKKNTIQTDDKTKPSV